MRDDIDLVLGYTVNIMEESGAVGAHDDEPLRKSGDLVHRSTLHGIRLAEDGVNGGHDRHAQFAQEREQVVTGVATENTVLVLHGHDIDLVSVQIIRGDAV